MENIIDLKKYGVIEIKEIPVDDVWYDASYQRKVNSKRVAKIAEEYDSHRMRPIEVSYRDGKYYIWDGQHRTEAYRTLGIKTIPARIHYNLTREDEAFLFAEQHKNESHISKRDEWNARMTAGNRDLETKEIVRICGDMGFEITPHASGNNYQKHKNEIHAISELQKIYRSFGETGLVTVLRFIGNVWDSDCCSTHREIIGGISCILSSYESMSNKQWDRIMKLLRKVTPNELLRQSISYGKNGKRGSKAVAKCIIENYLNKGLRDDDMMLNTSFIR